MRTCAQIQEDFVEGLYGELDQHRQRSLQAHLKTCADCRREFESLRATLEVMSRRQRPQPAEDPETASSLQQLQDQILRSARDSRVQPLRPATAWRSNSRWLMQMAAGIALIAIGVVIGRMTIDRGPSIEGQSVELASAPAEPDEGTVRVASADLIRRVGGYVSSSQALLVGLANLDTEAEGIESFDLAPQRQLSRRLLKEASYLRGTLDNRESSELVELISDLESILRQIANLEAKHDLEGIEIIRQGVESSGILIKIQLQKIRPHPVVPQRDAKSKEAA